MDSEPKITLLESDEEIDRLIQQEKQEESNYIFQQTGILKEIAEEINFLIGKSKIPLEEANINMETAIIEVSESNKELETAKQYKKGKKIFVITGILTAIGISLLGPLGAYAGAQIGIELIGGIVGSVAGGGIFGGTTYKICKKNKK